MPRYKTLVTVDKELGKNHTCKNECFELYELVELIKVAKINNTGSIIHLDRWFTFFELTIIRYHDNIRQTLLRINGQSFLLSFVFTSRIVQPITFTASNFLNYCCASFTLFECLLIGIFSCNFYKSVFTIRFYSYNFLTMLNIMQLINKHFVNWWYKVLTAFSINYCSIIVFSCTNAIWKIVICTVFPTFICFKNQTKNKYIRTLGIINI